MIKKIVSICLTLIMVLSLGSIYSVNALSNNGFEYAILDDGTIEIVGYNGSDTDVVIPSQIEGVTVTSIGYGAFEDCTYLLNITISNGIQVIDDHAFSNCSELTSITIPSSITNIGDFVFSGCTNLESINVASNNLYYSSKEGILYNKNQDKLIKAPITIKKCIVPNGVLSIEQYAFGGCVNLTNIILPNSLMSIKDYAFIGCIGLKNITIPSGVTAIWDYAFKDCTNLEAIDVVTENKEYASIGGVLYNKTREELIYAPKGIKDYTIPSNVLGILGIRDHAFSNCIKLSNIIIPNDVTSIDSFTFSGCTSLTNITIPESVTHIGCFAFDRCSNLMNIIIPSSVTNIDDSAFDNCNKNLSINTYKGSYAEEYAREKNILCKILEKHIASVNLDKTSLTLNKNAIATLKATINPTDTTDSKTLTWTSSNTNVATVNNEVVKGIGVGTATITVRTVNGKTATCKVTVQEVKTNTPTKPKVSINKTKITVKNATYTGKAIKQKVTIKYGNKTLKNGTDYTLSYKNNKNTGKATITIKGKGNYTGSKTINFYIVPKKVTISSVKPGKKQLTVKYKKVTGASGYQIAYSTSKSKGYKYITVNSKTASKVIKKLKSKKKYYVKVRAYKSVGKKKYYGSYSNIKSVKVK